jgi:glycerol-3-phosphate acyltransferase PlsY
MSARDLFATVALMLGAYLLGSVPFSFLVARARGVDLRAVGSGNLGGANVWRSCGFGPFLVAVTCDLLKGFLPARAGLWLGLPPPSVVLIGVCAILGHTFSLFMRFRGGKAVATSGGVLLAIAPLLMLFGIAVWVIVLLAARISSVASLAAAGAVVAVATALLLLGRLSPAYAALVWGGAALIVYLHRANIQRLRNGTENRFQKLL